VLVSLIVGVGVVRAWESLKHSHEEYITRIAEAESYATRAQLIRNVERMLSSLKNSRAFWAMYGSVPRAQWRGESEVELHTVPGARIVLWDDPLSGTRFVHSPEHPVSDYRPDETQWKRYEPSVVRARQATADTIEGPFRDSNNRPYFEVYLVDENEPIGGRLIAVIDAEEALETLLTDESPGYALRVLWRDELIYERGEHASDIPRNWIREGYIRSSLGSLWKVVHAPTAELAGTLISPAVDLLLVLGLVIAVLMGTLTFENWRAYSRAVAAERAERKLAELNRNLEQEIAARTAQLAQRTEDLQTLSDSVTHDMRNPLSVIATNIQLFDARQSGQLDAESLAPLKRIEPAIRQMTDILDRMIGLSSATHATFTRQPLKMADLVREVWDSLATTKSDLPAFDVGPLPEIEADHTLVKILLLNLLSNAIKYTRGRENARVEVTGRVLDGPAVYCVSDNGIGFEPRLADRLFQAFERLEQPREEPGLGLGLTIAARVVERHGGRIWAEGKAGERAAFYFTLEPQSETGSLATATT